MRENQARLGRGAALRTPSGSKEKKEKNDVDSEGAR
jgi:hypothetical protein